MFPLCTEIFCPAFTQTKISGATYEDDTANKNDCYDNIENRQIGTKCKVTCKEGYKPTASGETSTCTLEPVAKLTATWEGTLACEGIHICTRKLYMNLSFLKTIICLPHLLQKHHYVSFMLRNSLSCIFTK